MADISAIKEMGSLTLIVKNFSIIFQNAVKNITPYALSLFTSIVTIDIAWNLGMVLIENRPLWSTVVRKIVYYGMFLWIIQNYADVVGKVFNTFLTIGIAAGGNVLAKSVLTDPSYIIDMGLKTFFPIFGSIGLTNVLFSPRPLIAILSYLFTTFGYFIIAMQMFIAYLEFYIISGLAVFFLPFACLEKTAFLSEKAISAVIAVSVRVMVIAFVLSASLPFLEELQSTSNFLAGADSTVFMKFMFAVLAVAFLSWQAPSLAMGLFTGSPSLSGGQAISAGMMVAAIVSRTVTSGFQGLKGYMESVRTSAAADGVADNGGFANTVKAATAADGNQGSNGVPGSGIDMSNGPSLASQMNLDSIAPNTAGGRSATENPLGANPGVPSLASQMDASTIAENSNTRDSTGGISQDINSAGNTEGHVKDSMPFAEASDSSLPQESISGQIGNLNERSSDTVADSGNVASGSNLGDSFTTPGFNTSLMDDKEQETNKS